MILNPGMSGGGGDDTFEWKEIGTASGFVGRSGYGVITIGSVKCYGQLIAKIKISGTIKANATATSIIIGVGDSSSLDIFINYMDKNETRSVSETIWPAFNDVSIRPSPSGTSVAYSGGYNETSKSHSASYSDGTYTIRLNCANANVTPNLNFSVSLYGRFEIDH